MKSANSTPTRMRLAGCLRAPAGRAIALTAACALMAAWAAGPMTAPARADGDPASDVLATQQLFLPWDARFPAGRQAQLTALLAASARSGYPIRAAIIASASDLGSVTVLWRRPQEYAELLGEELSLVYRGPLLVIMPDGFGLYQQDRTASLHRSALAGVPLPAAAGGLAGAAVAAVEHLASGAGHPLAVSGTRPAAGASPVAVTPWLVFAAGWGLIALAWTLSLRARPMRIRPPRPSRRRT
jgi:hypothetical protein